MVKVNSSAVALDRNVSECKSLQTKYHCPRHPSDVAEVEELFEEQVEELTHHAFKAGVSTSTL